jgi:hypothetical protein
MEPQIIDYYNEMPYSVNVIDKMNTEFSELQDKYNELYKKINKFKIPYIIVTNIDDYHLNNNNITKFRSKIKEILNDKENGLVKILDSNPYYPPLRTLYDKFNYYRNGISCGKLIKCSGYPPNYVFILDIINELDNLTKNKNKEWCEYHINISSESCLNKYQIEYNEIDTIIVDLIEHIFDDELLPSSYIDLLYDYNDDVKIPFLEVCYNCEKCNYLSGDIGNTNRLLCEECR